MKDLTRDLLTFLDESTCNFLAVKNIRRRLDACGFQSLDLRDHWDLKAGGNYYTTINDSALFAFRVGEGEAHEGFRIVCSHTDSPGFRLKPNCEITSDGNMLTLNTEVYGGPILYTWFDRPLSISGRVVLRSEDPFRHEVRMVKFSRPLLTIPHLAIHYNRSVNEGNPLSKQRDMLPLMAILDDQHETKGCITRMVADELGISEAQIADYDLTLYATEPACTFGMHDEFISASRIDDLEMAHCALTALCNAVEGKKVDEDYAGEATAAAAKWLARNSRVVIFDEPTRGIDVAAKVEIYNLMNQLKQQGIAVMFVSSEMPEVMGIADRIIVMCDGRITGEVMAKETTQAEILTLATKFENKFAADAAQGGTEK